MKIWGCKVWIHVPKERDSDKLNPRAEEGVFIGYTESSNQYLVLTGRGVIKATSPWFLENEKGGTVSQTWLEHSNADANKSNKETDTRLGFEGLNLTFDEDLDDIGLVEEGEEVEDESSGAATNKNPQNPPRENPPNLPLENPPNPPTNDQLTTDENEAPNTEEGTLIRTRHGRTVRPSRQAQEAAETERLLARNRANLSVEFHHLVSEVLESALIAKAIRHPISSSIPLLERYEEAINNLIYSKKWREAIQKELEQLRIFETWELVKRPIS